MKKYQNPIPDLDDELQSKSVVITFQFEDPVTRSEAAENINTWLQSNRLTTEMVQLRGAMGIKFKKVQNRLGEFDRDPLGYGPRNNGGN